MGNSDGEGSGPSSSPLQAAKLAREFLKSRAENVLTDLRCATAAVVIGLIRVLCGDVDTTIGIFQRDNHDHENAGASARENRWIEVSAKCLSQPLLRLLPHLVPAEQTAYGRHGIAATGGKETKAVAVGKVAAVVAAKP